MKKENGINKSVIPAVVIGFLAVIFICTAATMVIPVMVIRELIEIDSMIVYVVLFRTAAFFIGSVVTGVLVQKNKSMEIYLCAALGFLFLCTLGLLFNTVDSKSIIYGMLCCVVGSVLANVVVIRLTKSKRTKRNIRRSR
jgi:peptidoglycan/LPS O-acetylase OafA/YrhL